jgi:hypothetical protein
MKVAMVTVMAMTQGLARGCHVSWNDAVAEDARDRPFSHCRFLAAAFGFARVFRPCGQGGIGKWAGVVWV